MSKLADLQLATGAIRPFTFKHHKRNGDAEDVHVLIRVLAKSEHDRARVNAAATVKALGPQLTDGKSTDELLAEARTIELLAAACMDPDKPSEPWASPLEIAQTLHPGAIAALARAYEEHQEECGPFVRDLTDEQYNALVELVASEGSADPLALFAWPLRTAFIITMARELVSLRIDKSSCSSASPEPLNGSEPTSPSDDDLAGAITDANAEIALLRNNYASLAVRVAHIEAMRHTEA